MQTLVEDFLQSPRHEHGQSNNTAKLAGDYNLRDGL
jgi:hypothetical protein